MPRETTYTSLRENLARYNRTHLGGYVVVGSTGESVLLTFDEIDKKIEETVALGGTAVGTTLIGVGPTISGQQDAEQYVSSGGIASATLVSSGGRVTASGGGLIAWRSG